ncbi:MAG: fibrobacter succinogenes major paralogous domain-containing protein [Candidatus Marinimicrobia bacterium]|nr:fibrobacter succinogenes major paralogous domain-containing protein [Candidatus Neomarinimicrobiota bacterium]
MRLRRQITPEGWHVPSDEEWKELEMYLGMSQSEADAAGWRGMGEGGKLKETGTIHWNSPNTGATNESGFSAAAPGGYRHSTGYYYDMGSYAAFWSSTQGTSYYAWYRGLYYYGSGIYRGLDYKQYGFSVRCVIDSANDNNFHKQTTISITGFRFVVSGISLLFFYLYPDEIGIGNIY